MTRRLTISPCLLVLVLCASLLRAQDPAPRQKEVVLGIVDTVIIGGNEKTMAYVILDEMALKPGSAVTEEAIEYDRNRIYSLGLFTRVDILFDSVASRRFLFVDVRERWYIIPVPILGFRDGDPARVFFGGGLLHTNFRGRNQKLYGAIVFGFDPAVSFSFADPMFDREDNMYISASVSSASVRNRSLVESALTGDFDERHFDINGTVGKRFTLFEAASVNFGIHNVKVSSPRPGRTASSDGQDLFLYGSVSYSFDSRDLREYATRGSFFTMFYTKNGFGEESVDFSRFGIDARKFVPLLPDVTLAGRAHAEMVSGSIIPTYARGYYGSSERIRGYYKTVWEGENLAGGTLELRYVLLKTRTFAVTMLPLPPEFAYWRFGVSIALFADAGLAWFRRDRIQLSSFGSGYGAGLHFLLPYGYVLRTEYAWNDYGTGQFIIDLRTSI